MPGLTIHAALSAAARRAPGKVAIVHERGALAYRALESASRRLASALRHGLGLRTGERVGVLLANSPEFYVAALAVSRAGLVLVPVPHRSTARELEHVAADSRLRALLTDAEAAERLEEALRALDGVAVHAWERPLGRSAPVEELVAAAAEGADAEVDGAAPFFFGYTSGTTGRPKAAVVSQRARTLLMLLLGQEYGCYAASHTSLVATPLYHGAGLTRGLTPLAGGGAVVLQRRFDPERAVRDLDAGRVDATFMVPAMWAALLELPRPARAPTRERPLTLLSNAAALPEHLKHGLLERWPDARLFEIYGSTEAGTVSSLRPEDQLRKPRCVGQPLALTEVRLTGPDGAEVATGEVGELWSRSPFRFDGYHGNPEATAEALVDGFVSAGDLARADDEGFLYVVGRSKDVIVSGGVNVYPREVEEVLAEHPQVREAAVVGVADPRWGEIVHAVVVPARDARPDPAELDAHCRSALAPAKLPRAYSFRDSLPRTPSGKVLKRELPGPS